VTALINISTIGFDAIMYEENLNKKNYEQLSINMPRKIDKRALADWHNLINSKFFSLITAHTFTKTAKMANLFIASAEDEQKINSWQ